MDVIVRKLYERGGWKLHTNLQETHIIKLLKFVLTTATLNSTGHNTMTEFPRVLLIIADRVQERVIKNLTLNGYPNQFIYISN